MDWITADIAVGNVEDALAIRGPELAVDSVLCLSGFPTLSHLPGLCWSGVPLVDGPGNEPRQFLEALRVIHSEREAGRRILVHCMEGRSRSVLLVALYLAAAGDHALDHGIHLVAQRRTIAAVDSGLLLSLPAAWRERPREALARRGLEASMGLRTTA